jgi:hypothetical protein
MARKSVNRRSAHKSTAPEPKFTREELLADIGKVLDDVDRVMLEQRPVEEHVQWHSAWGTLAKQREKMNGLLRLLEAEVNPKGHYDAAGAKEAVLAAFGVEGGTVPGWARPGQFLMWLGYIPYRCTWGGFANPEARMEAVDPALPFTERSGHHFAHGVARMILEDWPTVDAGFRAALEQLAEAKEFKLHPLPVGLRVDLTEWLAKPESAWAVAAIRRGPLNEVALPPRFSGVQRRLFA